MLRFSPSPGKGTLASERCLTPSHSKILSCEIVLRASRRCCRKYRRKSPLRMPSMHCSDLRSLERRDFARSLMKAGLTSWSRFASEYICAQPASGLDRADMDRRVDLVAFEQGARGAADGDRQQPWQRGAAACPVNPPNLHSGAAACFCARPATLCIEPAAAWQRYQSWPVLCRDHHRSGYQAQLLRRGSKPGTYHPRTGCLTWPTSPCFIRLPPSLILSHSLAPASWKQAQACCVRTASCNQFPIIRSALSIGRFGSVRKRRSALPGATHSILVHRALDGPKYRAQSVCDKRVAGCSARRWNLM